MLGTGTARRLGVGGVQLAAAVLSIGVAAFSYRYLIGVGPRGAEILSNLFAQPWLYLHIAGAATALLVGTFQFRPAAPRRGGRHRWLGRLYAVGCLLGALAGFVLAFGSFAGPIVALGFGSLALTWFATTALGWRAALQQRFADHRAWMVRSWSLTLAAVTLRVYLALFPILHIPFLQGYRAVSFLAWLPNLLIAELYLGRKRRSSARPDLLEVAAGDRLHILRTQRRAEPAPSLRAGE